MKKFLSLLMASLLFIAVADAQTNRRTNVQDAHDRYNQDTLTLTKAQNKRSGNKGKPATRIADSTRKALPVHKEQKTTDNSIFMERKVL